MPEPQLWNDQMEAPGAFIRSQRKPARLSLRQVAGLTTLSSPYLSQVQRGELSHWLTARIDGDARSGSFR